MYGLSCWWRGCGFIRRNRAGMFWWERGCGDVVITQDVKVAPTIVITRMRCSAVQCRTIPLSQRNARISTHEILNPYWNNEKNFALLILSVMSPNAISLVVMCSLRAARYISEIYCFGTFLSNFYSSPYPLVEPLNQFSLLLAQTIPWPKEAIWVSLLTNIV